MRRLTLPLTLGLAHGVADGAAGMLLGSLPRLMDLGQVALLVLLYNALAFGGQPIVGLLADRVGRPRAAALAGLLLLGAALVAFGPQPRLAVALAGLGSAAFHVGGGALALCATRGRAAGPGLFAAPGVVGLAAGGALAAGGYLLAWPLLLMLGVLMLAILELKLPALPYGLTTDHRPLTTNRETGDLRLVTSEGPQAASVKPQASPKTVVEFETHDLIMLALLAGIALRSAVWSSLQFLFEGRYEMLLAMAVAAALGKIAGGALADWLGWRRWALGALVLAAPLLALAGQSLAALLAGIALLQSATPVALAATAGLLPRRPATAAGLGLGLAIAVGGVPAMGGLSPALVAPALLTSMLVAAALALWWGLRHVARSTTHIASG
jgi:FSR family fosmidomycin resistance protein-like MFS transporter